MRATPQNTCLSTEVRREVYVRNPASAGQAASQPSAGWAHSGRHGRVPTSAGDGLRRSRLPGGQPSTTPLQTSVPLSWQRARSAARLYTSSPANPMPSAPLREPGARRGRRPDARSLLRSWRESAHVSWPRPIETSPRCPNGGPVASEATTVQGACGRVLFGNLPPKRCPCSRLHRREGGRTRRLVASGSQ